MSEHTSGEAHCPRGLDSRLRLYATGRPKKAVPKSPMKHAAESPPTSARPPAERGNTICASVLGRVAPARKLRNVSHSLMKPLKSGSPAIEQHATRRLV